MQRQRVQYQEHSQNMQLRHESHQQTLTHRSQVMEQKHFIMQKTNHLETEIKWREDQAEQRRLQQEREATLAHNRRAHQEKLQGMDRQQRLQMAYACKVDKQKLQTASQQRQIKAAQARDGVNSAKTKNRQNIAYQKALTQNQHYNHTMKMEEIAAKRENMGV